MSRSLYDGVSDVSSPTGTSFALDLRHYAQTIIHDLRDADVRILLRRQATDVEPLRDLPWRAWSSLAESVTQRALDRGDVATVADTNRALEMTVAMVWMSLVVDGRAMGNDELDRVIADALAIARRVGPPES